MLGFRRPMPVAKYGVLIAVAGLLCVIVLRAVPERKTSRPHPTIVMVLADDLSQSVYDATPGLDTIAASGVRFTTITSTPLCGPTRAAILTGKYPHNSGIQSNKRSNVAVWNARHLGNTVPDWLRAAGYFTIGAGKFVSGIKPRFGIHGFDEWIEVEHDKRTGLTPGGTYWVDELIQRTKAAIRAAPADRPVFVHFSPATPHGPFVPAPRYAGSAATLRLPRGPSFLEEDLSDKEDRVRTRDHVDEAQIATITARWQMQVEQTRSLVDAISAIDEVLVETNREQDRYLLFSSDNGFNAGEHGIPSGKGLPYLESLEVPSFALGPDVAVGTRLKSLIVSHDFAATIAELAGVDTPSIDGVSIAPLLRGARPAWRRRVYVSFHSARRDVPTWEGVRTRSRSAVVWYPSLWTEGYGPNDPYELDSHCKGRPFARCIPTLSSRLDALRSCAGNDCWRVETER
ncbi:MAG: hypothetical protein FJ148_22690 [Deltaproteobacteria bacterium]|nr:hypothetical protein [Deltaproteobacteria bacterium]